MNRSTHASGIILKTQNIFEHDKLIEVFTEKNGKTKYLAKYTNRPKSKKAGILEVTNVISFVAYSSKSFKLITECNTIKTFPKIRSSFNKLSSSLHIIDVIQKSTIFEQNNTPLYLLTIDTLTKLSHCKDPEQIKIDCELGADLLTLETAEQILTHNPWGASYTAQILAYDGTQTIKMQPFETFERSTKMNIVDPTADVPIRRFIPKIDEKVKQNNRTRYIALCKFLNSEYGITVKDVIPEDGKPFSKVFNKKNKELILSDYLSLETKKLHAASQIVQEGAIDEINRLLETFNFPSEESKKLTKVALLNYCGAAILMPYKLFHSECKKLKYDLELLQNTFATSFEQVTHRVTCLNDPNLPGVPFHFLRVDVAGNISKRFSLSGIEIPRYGGACPRWNVYSAFSRPGVIQAAVSKMTNGEKYVCIARTVEKGIGRYGQKKSMLSIGLGCEAKYAKDFVYTENLDIHDKKSEIPVGVSCRTCDRLDCSQRAFPPLHKKFDVDINNRGVSVYVND